MAGGLELLGIDLVFLVAALLIHALGEEVVNQLFTVKRPVAPFRARRDAGVLSLEHGVDSGKNGGFHEVTKDAIEALQRR